METIDDDVFHPKTDLHTGLLETSQIVSQNSISAVPGDTTAQILHESAQHTVTQTLSPPRDSTRRTVRAEDSRQERILVGVTDTPESEWAFFHVLNHVNPGDVVYVVSVTWAYVSEENTSRKILCKFGQEARRFGVHNVHLVLVLHQDVAVGICGTAKIVKATSVVLGHSNKSSWINTVFSPSISKYCESHCQCPIMTVSTPTKFNRIVSEPFSRSFGTGSVINGEREDRLRRGDVIIVGGLNDILYKEVVVENVI